MRGAVLALILALLGGCQITYTWGPNGNSLSGGLDPSKIDPGVLGHGQQFIENHWLDQR